jgi:tRNA pseudouridine38-40 synthase
MRLPPAVRVLSAEPVADGFHARFDALAKLYRYQIWNGDVVSPFERRYVWHIARPALDAAAMDAAARRLEGRHDFAAFAAAGREPETTVRTIFSSRVHRAHDRYGLRPQRDAAAVGAATDAPHDRASAPFDAPLIVYEVSGDGFLRHMVRAIVGTLVEIGRGRRAPAWMDDVLSSRERHAAGRTAPPAGLVLAQVRYR